MTLSVIFVLCIADQLPLPIPSLPEQGISGTDGTHSTNSDQADSFECPAKTKNESSSFGPPIDEQASHEPAEPKELCATPQVKLPSHETLNESISTLQPCPDATLPPTRNQNETITSNLWSNEQILESTEPEQLQPEDPQGNMLSCGATDEYVSSILPHSDKSLLNKDLSKESSAGQFIEGDDATSVKESGIQSAVQDDSKNIHNGIVENLLSHDTAHQYTSGLLAHVKEILKEKTLYTQSPTGIDNNSLKATTGSETVQGIEVATNSKDVRKDSVDEDAIEVTSKSTNSEDVENEIAQNQVEIDQLSRRPGFTDTDCIVLCSGEVMKFLKSKSTPKNISNSVLRVICEIADGSRKHNIKRHVLLEKHGLYEAMVNKTTRIIWQDRLRYLFEKEIQGEKEQLYAKAVTILAITTKHGHDQQRTIEKAKYAVQQASHSNITVPVKLLREQPHEESGSFSQKYKVVVMDSKPDEIFRPLPNIEGSEYSPMQFHKLSEVLKLLLNPDDLLATCPMELSQVESEIVCCEYKQPIILHGRSGTGKTTICLYRMYNEFKMFCQVMASPQEDNEEDHEGTENFLKLAFITKNHLLCMQMMNKFHGIARIEESMRTVMSFDDKIPYRFTDVKNDQYPLFLTSRQFLLMLDATLDGEPFFEKYEDGSVSCEIVSSDYSYMYNEVEDILEMEESESEDELKNTFSVEKRKQIIEITADYFVSYIWEKIASDEIKRQKVDPLLVWMEIRSVIKGSKEALSSPEGYLSLDEYLNFGERVAPTFVEGSFNRASVYELFLKYKRFVSEKEGVKLFDECTLIHNLYQRVYKTKHSKVIDHFYIDEVQDFTQAELALILSCSSNKQATFCTGDTAQTIMKGVAFRFKDLRTQFWKIASEQSHPKMKKRNIPKLYTLCDNFRCHSGILSLAQGIIDLLKCYFSHSFDDNLPIDRAAFVGPKPILLEPSSPDDLALVLLGNQEGTSTIDFGAHQVIIVRNDESKAKLPECIREGIVLTALEAKGLEFEDVLLYNFFTDSPVSVRNTQMLTLEIISFLFCLGQSR